MQRQQGHIVEQTLHRTVIRDHMVLHEKALRIRQQGGRLIRAVTHDAVHVVRQTKKAYRYPVRLSCFVRPRGCGYFIS